jgi:hypothetical protein
MPATEGAWSAFSAPAAGLRPATTAGSTLSRTASNRSGRTSSSRLRFRELLNRHRRRLAESADPPALSKIELLLKLEREVEAQETLERLNALTREVG